MRADGSNFLGLGHLIRSLSLAQYLKEHYRVSFVFRQIPDSIKKKLNSSGFGLIEIKDEEEALSLPHAESIVVLDGYQFSSEYQKRWKQKKCKVISIDDTQEGIFYSDLIINQAPGIQIEQYNAQWYTQFALGPDYTLLRLPFIKAARNIRRVENISTVLICFGGSDYNNLTKKCAQIAKEFNQFKRIIIITGSAYNHSLEHSVFTDSRIEHYSDVSAKKMAALMKLSDLAIVPASGILFEALAVGCRVISGYYNENQLQIYHGFKNLEAFTDAKTFRDDEIVNALSTIKPGKTEHIIDGESPNRFVELFKKLSNKEFETI